FLGDLSAAPQRQLLARGGVRGPYAVVKVAHHGSRDQEPTLYDAAGATVALFTGGENDYGHPHPAALAMVGRAHTPRTDTQGRVLLGVEEGALRVWAERSDE